MFVRVCVYAHVYVYVCVCMLTWCVHSRNCILTLVADTGLHDDVTHMSHASSFTPDIHSGESCGTGRTQSGSTVCHLKAV